MKTLFNYTLVPSILLKKVLPLLVFIFILFTSKLKGGNEPCSATFLNNSSTDFHYFDNSFNTNSAIIAPPFGNYLGPDTWISFTMPANGQLYLIIESGTMTDPAIALYSGNCTEPKLLYNVLDNNCNGNVGPNILLNNLNVGETYFIRIWAQAGSVNGDFSVYLNSNLANIPGFDAFADAVDLGDCIQLTAQTGSQQGCAWYQIPIDFSLPFTHTMSANFGTKDADGADGITLVYQSNGSDFCGGTGEGIGAAGMPNSAIFEFDTWQNGNLNDPVQDHCAFNINGNMNHNASIAGPIILGNIEDGLDHDIEFSWNPVGNVYILYFDGTLMFSGSYDFINNLFGGSNLAYWGYTASTGGSNNNQIICPGVVEYVFSTQEYQEVSICEGDNYLGYTETGFYVAFFPDGTGCNHQLNIDLSILPNSPPTEIFETVCKGEYIIINSQLFTESGFYTIAGLNGNFCDSTIFLNLEVIEGNLDITASGPLNCKAESIFLIPNISSNQDVFIEGFSWTGPMTSGQEILEITQSGTYQLLTAVTFNGITCTLIDNIVIGIDDTSPLIYGIEDVTIDCDSTDLATSLIANVENLPNLQFEWSFGDSIVSIVDSVPISGIGAYMLTVTNLDNGCVSRDTGQTILSLDFPSIEILPDTLNCKDTTIKLSTISSNDVVEYEWFFENTIFSTESNPEIQAEGKYSVTAINDKGCKTTSDILIEKDTVLPTSSLTSNPIACNQDTTSIHLAVDPNFDIIWAGPNGFIHSKSDIIIDESGQYYFTITNPENHCFVRDSVDIISYGDSPIIEIDADIINCYHKEIELSASTDQSDATVSWIFENEVVSDENLIDVSNGGKYSVIAISPSGCLSDAEVNILVDTLYPSLSLFADTIDCTNNEAIIQAVYDSNFAIEWSWANGVQVQTYQITTHESGVFTASVFNAQNGCLTLEEIQVIDIRDYPEFILNADTIDCIKKEFNLDFNLDSDVLGIAWSGPNNFYSDIENPLISDGGAYYLHLDVIGDCDIDTFVNIIENTIPPEFTFQYDSITCKNNTAEIQINLSGQNESVKIQSPSGLISNEHTLMTEEYGLFIISVTGTNGCMEEDSFIILSFLELPEVSIQQQNVIDCNNRTTAILVDNIEELSYTWMNSDGFMASTKELVVDQGGIFTLQISNRYGCENEYEIEIVDSLIYPEVRAFGNDIDCYTQEALLHFEADDEYISRKWTGQNGFLSVLEEVNTPNAGLYTISITNRHGCSDIDSVIINENTEVPEISTSLTSPITILLDNSNRSLPISVSSIADYMISWNPETGLSCNDCEEPELLENSESRYLVSVVNEYGCIAELSFEIEYQQEVIVTIPNVFTPGNKDGFNDFFVVYGNSNIESINYMQIFDRWGQMLFDKKNLMPNNENEGWDGTFNTKLVIPGVYVYKIEVLTTQQERIFFIGDVTVLE